MARKKETRKQAQDRSDAFRAKLAKSDAADLRKAKARFAKGPATEGQISFALSAKPLTARFVEYDNRAERAILSLLKSRLIKASGWSAGHARWELRKRSTARNPTSAWPASRSGRAKVLAGSSRNPRGKAKAKRQAYCRETYTDALRWSPARRQKEQAACAAFLRSSSGGDTASTRSVAREMRAIRYAGLDAGSSRNPGRKKKAARNASKKFQFAGYDLESDSCGLTVSRDRVDYGKTGDHGADPLGNGRFRVVPSGDVVSLSEMDRRLSTRNPQSRLGAYRMFGTDHRYYLEVTARTKAAAAKRKKSLLSGYWVRVVATTKGYQVWAAPRMHRSTARNPAKKTATRITGSNAALRKDLIRAGYSAAKVDQMISAERAWLAVAEAEARGWVRRRSPGKARFILAINRRFRRATIAFAASQQ